MQRPEVWQLGGLSLGPQWPLPACGLYRDAERVRLAETDPHALGLAAP